MGAAPATVSVIITSHNYGRYLEAAILSVLAQSRPADEILVVDDASTDDTQQVARRFAGDGVKNLRVEFRNVHKARHAGFRATTGDALMFLDADNYLTRDYLQNGLREFTHRTVGVVYADLQRFGLTNRRTSFPAYSRAELMRENFVDVCALIRREALDVCDAFTLEVDTLVTQEDHLLFQRLAQDGWEFRKQSCALMYRTHDRQMSAQPGRSIHRRDHFAAHGLQYHDVTLFIPLAGRDVAWDEQSRFLERQSWPHDQIRLILCDTSQRPEFSKRLRDWIAECDYRDVRHFTFQAGTRGLADANRYHRPTERDVQNAMCRIYNRLRSALETDYCWILEDDVIPPDDVLERLLRHFRKDVATVCAPYLSRWDPDYVVWMTDRDTGDGRLHRAPKPPADAPQVTEIRGSGFGCLVARSHLIKQHIFTIPRGEPYYDPYFFRTLGDRWKRLCDWTCECRHLGFRGNGAH
jgi:GT2 family glycosyltransferase